MRVAIALSFLVLVTTACHLREGVDAPVTVARACPSVTIPVNGPAPAECVRLEGDDVGRLPLDLRVGGRTVRLAEWTQVDESSREVVGFAAHLPADVMFTVKVGDEHFIGAEPRWLNPHGVVGPRVHGIEQVTFCRVPPRPSGCEGATVVLDERPAQPSVIALAE